MHKVIQAIAVALLLAAAAAIELPERAKFTFIDVTGQVVGVGEIEDGKLELELLTGYNGLASVAVIDDNGQVKMFDATIGPDGSVILIDTVTLEFVDLNEAVALRGGELELSFDDELKDEEDLDDDDAEEEGDEEEADGEADDEEDSEDAGGADRNTVGEGDVDEDSDDADDDSEPDTNDVDEDGQAAGDDDED